MDTMPNRIVPKIPETGKKIPVLFDTDAANEIDDQFAIALALAMPERFDIKGFVATHFGDKPESTQASADEINRVLDLCGMKGKYPVHNGGDPLQYSKVHSPSKGVDFIIETAKSFTAENPLWLVVLGACTNTVSAFLKAPEIADKVNVLFHGRTQFWPRVCYNFNVFGDVKATRVLFTSPLPLVLFDTGSYLYASADETAKRLTPLGPIGSYLHEFRLRTDHWRSNKKAFFDLGDTALLAEPSLCKWEEAKAPGVDWDLAYKWEKKFGTIVRVYDIDRDRTFELFYKRIADAFGKGSR